MLVMRLRQRQKKPERQQRQARNRTHEIQIMAGTIRGSPVLRCQQVKRLTYVNRHPHKQKAGASQ